MIFGFLGSKPHRALRYKLKKSNFACKFFFRKCYIRAQSKFATKKGIKNFFLPQIVFLFMKKCISYNFHIRKLHDKHFFRPKLKICF